MYAYPALSRLGAEINILPNSVSLAQIYYDVDLREHVNTYCRALILSLFLMRSLTTY
jgi:hypothetical protein